MSLPRRHFLKTLAGSAGLGMTASPGRATPLSTSHHADACILLWLGGGAAHTDTWDPKRLGDPSTGKAGSAYASIDTTVPGVQVCSHLSNVAQQMEHLTILRTVQHQVIDEHAAAVNFVYTGRPVSGSVVYPSLGSLVSHELGAQIDGVPPYVLIGYPTVSRGPGFLGSKHSFLYTTDTRRGPAGLTRPSSISTNRQERRQSLQRQIRQAALAQHGAHDPIQGYDALIEAGHAMSSGDFKQAFDLDLEPAALRAGYGSEFGQRCLLARRLVERGSRFVEVLHNLNFSNGTGWDTHKDGQLNQHLLIQELDQALGALIADLQTKRRLDKTLIIVASEFGRPIGFDAYGGRGHQSSAFSVVLAGGGLNHHGALGETDVDAKLPVTDPISVPDLHATIHHCLGIDHAKNLYAGDRPVPITDRGTPVRALFI